MADLKSGTTVGGAPVWTQANFPLTPVGNTLFHKNFKVYTENDKPQAADNDFVSKSGGGTYNGTVYLNKNLAIAGDGGTVGNINSINLYGGIANGQLPTYGFFVGSTTGAGTGGVVLGTHGSVTGNWALFNYAANGGWIFRTNSGNVASINIYGTGAFNAVNVDLAPTIASHVTRKDYVDSAINTVTNNANTRVLRAGDTMTGNLTAPYFISQNPATQPAHVPRLDQVVVKGTIIDFGTY